MRNLMLSFLVISSVLTAASGMERLPNDPRGNSRGTDSTLERTPPNRSDSTPSQGPNSDDVTSPPPRAPDVPKPRKPVRGKGMPGTRRIDGSPAGATSSTGTGTGGTPEQSATTGAGANSDRNPPPVKAPPLARPE